MFSRITGEWKKDQDGQSMIREKVDPKFLLHIGDRTLNRFFIHYNTILHTRRQSVWIRGS